MSKTLAARLAAAALCLCLIAGGCGKNSDTPAATKDTPSIQTSSVTADIDDSDEVSSSAVSSEKAASSSSNASSKAAASEKTASSSAPSEKSVSNDAGSAAKDETTSVQEGKSDSVSEKTEKSDTGYKKDQTVTVSIEFGHIAANGSPAKIGAYDYTITYDTSLVEYISTEDQITEDMKVVNDKNPGEIKIAQISAMGFDEDFTGEPKATFKIKFRVKKDTDYLKITGECPSLTAISMDGKDMIPLINSKKTDDPYSKLVIE